MSDKKIYKKIMIGLLGSAMLLASGIGYAMPQGGDIVAGSGTIGIPSGGQMNITGNGGNMAIDWSSFGIGAGETVNFSNINAVLNYVTGKQRSEILGNMNGNGVHVFLINPNGILFGAGAQINVGNLTASTRSMSDDARNNFNGTIAALTDTDIANVKADIVNLGTVTADTLVMEGNNISIVSADKLIIADKSNISLKAKGAINIGYQVTDRTTVDVGDGQSPHDVANYLTGTGNKGSIALAGMSTTDLSGNNKSVNDCMLVNNIYELQNIQSNLNGNYMLAGDIDAGVTSGWYINGNYASNGTKGFIPLGAGRFSTTEFRGVLDGLGYTIQDIYMDMGSHNGYFAMIQKTGTSALINNLQITGTINGRSTLVSQNQGTISNIINHANVTATGSASGIVETNSGTVNNVINKGNVVGTNSAGVVGTNIGTITNAYNEGEISGKTAAGGVILFNNAGAVLQNAGNSGHIKNLSAGGDVGGVISRNYGTVSDAINNGRVEGYLTNDNTTSSTSIGGIVGDNKGGQIINATNNGEVSGGSDVGGIAGQNIANNNTAASIKNSVNNGNVTAKDWTAGGIVGDNGAGSIVEDVKNTGNITSSTGKFIGGIVGNNNNASVKRATNSGNITGITYVGGIVGNNRKGNISDVINTGDVASGNDSKQGYAGGIAGGSTGLVQNAQNSGKVSGRSFIGGIVGYMYEQGSITNTHNSGAVNVSISAGGGIVGYLDSGSIQNSYNTGNITGLSYIGGIVGNMTSNNVIRNVYNIAAVTADDQVAGGIVGNIDKGNNSITNAYNAGTVSGTDMVGSVIGDINSQTGIVNVNNTYFINNKGKYEQYGTGTTYNDLRSFNQAFVAGLEASDQDVWNIQNPTTPHLKYFLTEDITADLGNIDLAANANPLETLINKLTELGYQIDAGKLHILSNLQQGTYNWSDIIYSDQNGYDLNITGTVVIGTATDQPPAVGNIVDNRYDTLTADINNSKNTTWQYGNQQGYTFTEDTRLLTIDEHAIKLEDNKVTLQQEEKRKKLSAN